MRKAKSLLALVLAMLTLLAFLPTALADETPHAVKLTHGEHVSVKGEAPTTTIAGADLVIEYKSDDADHRRTQLHRLQPHGSRHRRLPEADDFR